MTFAKFLAAACWFALPATSVAAPISRQSLVQYQYETDVRQCNQTLPNGIRVEFTGVFANEPDGTVFHELVVFRIPTKASFGFATLAVVRYFDQAFFAKVVKLEPGAVYLALDESFLNLFWGSSSAFSVHEIERAGGRAVENFSLPENAGPARAALSKGKTCYEDAQAVN